MLMVFLRHLLIHSVFKNCYVFGTGRSKEKKDFIVTEIHKYNKLNSRDSCCILCELRNTCPLYHLRYMLVWTWWHTPFIPALERQRQVHF